MTARYLRAPAPAPIAACVTVAADPGVADATPSQAGRRTGP